MPATRSGEIELPDTFSETDLIAMSTPSNFQDVILTLEHFWASRGCLILQPTDVEVGAGTFNEGMVDWFVNGPEALDDIMAAIETSWPDVEPTE